MGRRFALIFATLGLLPGPTLAQDQSEADWPSVRLGGVDACDATAGVGLATYEFLSANPRHSKFILADICVDVEAGWLVGPETFEDLTLVQSFGDQGAQFEVIADGPTTIDRRGLTRSVVFTGLEEADEGMPIDVLAQFAGWMPGSRVALMPGTDLWSMNGYLFGPASRDPLPEGLWIAAVNAHYKSRLQGNEGVDGDVSAFNTTFHIFERTAEGFVLERSLMGAEPVHLGLQFGDAGEVAGGLTVEARNTRLVAARAPREYDTATLEIGWLKGRVVAADQGPVIAAVGVGRSVFRDVPGNVNVEDGWAMLTMAPFPPGMNAEAVEALFGGATQ